MCKPDTERKVPFTTGRLVAWAIWSHNPCSKTNHAEGIELDPAPQKAGFDRELLEAAEAYAAVHGTRKIEMTVVQSAMLSSPGANVEATVEPARPAFPHGDDRYACSTVIGLLLINLCKELP
ncbi:MAG: hypothetical protein M3Y24_03930 [Acidobacteriota bacterium]|nr:hypothetical protein [Acidobacteriota bacterium]